MPPEIWFHHGASAFVRKPFLVVHELDIAIVEKQVDFQSKGAMDEYARLNPNRKFPALRDGALVLWESNAIMGYLAALHGQHLLGDGLSAAARVQQWLFWELAHFGPAILGLSNLRLGFLPQPPRDAGTLEAELSKYFALLEQALASWPYLGGERVTIADLAIAADFTFATEAKVFPNRYPALAAWLRRIEQRPSWQATDERKKAALEAAGVK